MNRILLLFWVLCILFGMILGLRFITIGSYVLFGSGILIAISVGGVSYFRVRDPRIALLASLFPVIVFLAIFLIAQSGVVDFDSIIVFRRLRGTVTQFTVTIIPPRD